MNERAYLTTCQLAKRLGVTTATVRRRCKRGLAHERASGRGTHYRIAPLWVQAFLDRHPRLARRGRARADP